MSESVPAPARPPFSPLRRTPLLLVLLAIGTGSIAIAGFAGIAIGKSAVEADRHARAVTPRGPLLADEQQLVDLFRGSSPSVAHITTLRDVQRRWTRDVQRIPEGSGSGFIWDDDGHIVTNYHVIQTGDAYRVVLSDGKTYPAELVGAAPHKDLAVLRVNAPSDLLAPIDLGSSTDLQVGQSVYAIGNPFGLDQSLTRGVISALEREITSRMRTPIYDVIQSDAAVNPGSSGGPLLDSAGRLIGVNTAIYSPSGASAGISFSIPADTVRRIVPDLIAYGRVQKPLIGFLPYSGRWPRGFPQGVMVLEVPEESALERAGLRGTSTDELGDVILAINDRPTRTLKELEAVLERFRPGDAVRLTLVRGLTPEGEGGERVKIETRLQPPEEPR